MVKEQRLTMSPILVEDFRAVFGRDRAHRFGSFWVTRRPGGDLLRLEAHRPRSRRRYPADRGGDYGGDNRKQPGRVFKYGVRSASCPSVRCLAASCCLKVFFATPALR